MSHIAPPGRTLKVSASPGLANIFSGFSSATNNLPNPLAASSVLFPTPSSVPHDVQFNVIVRGQLFKLNYDLIMYDQPNMFTTAFLEGFAESESRTFTFPGRSPALFAVIYEYLSGYAILPNPAIDLRNLVSDCEYYGFQRLKDELTLPQLGDALSSRHNLSRAIRFEEVASRQSQNIEWTEHGLMDANEPSQHLLVFLTKVNFALDLTVKANGECSESSFTIELPPYASSLTSKPLDLKGASRMDWTAVTAEALSSTPFTLNDNEFEGNFSDLIHWVRSFISASAATSSSTRWVLAPQDAGAMEKLTKAMPGLADSLRLRALQGQTSMQLSTTFWVKEMSLIIAPPDGFGSTTSHIDSIIEDNNFVAKILNCSLSTGLHRRKALKALVNL